MSTPIRWVLFDYGAVISFEPIEEDWAALAKTAGGVSPERLQAAYWAYRADYDRADLDAEAYWEAVGTQLGVRLDAGKMADLIDRDTAMWSRLRHSILEVIDELATTGVRLALLSNAPRELAEAVREMPFTRHFSRLVFSCELRLCKPDPACFTRTLELLDAPAENVLFVDDRGENTAAAARMGFRVIRFDDPTTALAAVSAAVRAPAS